jgi:hypothetical protein
MGKVMAEVTLKTESKFLETLPSDIQKFARQFSDIRDGRNKSNAIVPTGDGKVTFGYLALDRMHISLAQIWKVVVTNSDLRFKVESICRDMGLKIKALNGVWTGYPSIKYSDFHDPKILSLLPSLYDALKEVVPKNPALNVVPL